MEQILGARASGGLDWLSLSGRVVEYHLGLITWLWKSSVSENTWSGYTQAWSRWGLFCQEINEHCSKSELSSAISFVCSLNDQLSVSSINKMLAGRVFLFKVEW